MADKRITDQTTDTSLSAGDYIIVDSESEGTRKFDLGTELTAIKAGLANIYVQDGKLYIDGVAYELGGVGISNIAKTGTDGLVDTYTITMTDGTTYTFTVTNGDASDAKIQGFIDDWLEEHPEATTTVQDGAITLAKLATEVTDMMSETDSTYKWNAVGYMREQVRPFQGWAQCVVFDPDLNCAVGIINSGNGSHTNAQPWYRVTIDNSGYMSPYQAIKVYDTDGTTEITPTVGYMGTTQRLSDGTYMCISQGQTIYTSTDKLVTLKKERVYNFTSNSDKSMFSLTELSNGRLICGHGGWVNGFWYSDNDGETWTNVVPSNSGLGNMVYPERTFTPFEPCFIECGNGKVLAIARKSMSAIATGTTAYTAQEPAVYSVSTDYGATWSAWQNSSVITDMTACNGKVAIIDGVAHFVYGSRYDNTDDDFRLYYTYAKLEDAYADDWETPVIIDRGQWDASTATNPHDSGYPSLWKDKNNNLYSVHYDSDGTGSAYGANWRLCTGAPIEKAQAVYNGGSGSCNVAYSQKAVDTKTNAIWSKINEILLLLDQLPDDPDDYSGASPIYSDLVAWFDVTQESKWEDSTLTSMIGSNSIKGANASLSGAQLKYVAPTAFNNGFSNAPSLWLVTSLSDLGVSGAFTLEFVDYNTDTDGSNYCLIFKENTTLNTSNTNNPNIYSRKRHNMGRGNLVGIHHYVGIFAEGTITWYVDGSLATTETTEVTLATFLAGYPFFCARQATGFHSDVRVYNRALTSDEIHNNYLYTQNETDYTQAPVFTTS